MAADETALADRTAMLRQFATWSSMQRLRFLVDAVTVHVNHRGEGYHLLGGRWSRKKVQPRSGAPKTERCQCISINLKGQLGRSSSICPVPASISDSSQ